MRPVAPLALALAFALVAGSGCGTTPKSFRSLVDPSPLARARAVGLGDQKSDQQVIPALIARLEDPDPVVRLSAHEGLRARTSQDFGYVAWAEPSERAQSVARWQEWWKAQQQPQVAQAGLGKSRGKP